MTGTSVLPPSQAHPLLSKEPTPSLEASSSYTEQQECVSFIRKCKSKRELKQAHTQILKSGLFSDSLCSGSLLAACALSDWGSMDYACSIFRGVEDPDTFLFNVTIRGFVRAGNWARALDLYREMLEIGVKPDKFTYPALLKACARSSALEDGKRIHGHLVKLGFGDDLFVQNSLVSMYGKCGGLKLARKIFNRTAGKSAASWSAIIGAHARSGEWSDCLKLFREMGMESQSCRAEESAMVNVLSAVTRLGALDLGKSVHASLLRNISALNAAVETSLIDMYTNCGFLEKGLSIFREMGERRNLLTYSAMISGLAMHGRGKEAVEIFSEMLREGFEPDEAIYVGVLSACSHAGLVEEGLDWFEKMRIKPTIRHYACVVDLLGRAGRLKEALELIETMSVKPNDVVYRTLLGACKVHGDVEIAEIAAERLFRSGSRNAGDYIAMSNIYARAQRWDDFARLRARMADQGLAQISGISAVEVKRNVFEFKSYEISRSDVREMIHQMEWQLRFDGYVADTSQVSLEGDEDEKRERLKYHSQKIAIAFALVHSDPGAPVRIVRNVRMCSDCHTYTKFISVIYEREILVRERNRFHRFKDGSCSCRDYW